ncbi:hypothetical protein I7Z51_005023 [Vibrio parahaemolyticus]|uniref:hypothetical protein n=1 Tax=Vibrio parahaemolyticus TaxID=670 RepID=UPI001B835F2D|nr:hypothetical protein [Vibrio parahaemolyticus]EGQ7975999.1 hypothetical protein [Vibrio parahaemolyticus]MCI9692328.1 hypothetical protein [Vibrio parahaemolyticus]MCR9810692.1 hypothetical protein [Vibrio parahaemolyticus]MCR9929521.1 hypothetical protein [Vibrio parahaemolyticus]HBC3593104.1 hypothetical protein [Vibrio parahaemolyticus]
MKALGLATNKAFKRDSQRLAVLVELAQVFTAQWFSLGGMRCSPLNAALALGWHQRLKVSVSIGFFSSLYT